MSEKNSTLAQRPSNVTSLIRGLPDPTNAEHFLERLEDEHPRQAAKLFSDEALLSDVLALAAWSPLLGATLLQHTGYIQWLARDRNFTRVRTRQEFGESLARFALTNTSLDSHVVLARFRRRELLRIYLHDLRRIRTLVEAMEELSNLADAVLEYALGLARQELDNRYGSPLGTDDRGRASAASFCVVALGKLGSLELNYASDIDLLFLYSDDGATSGHGTRDPITNREYFSRLAGMIAKFVGHPSGEGAAYRVDLRLRPFGHDGVLASSVGEAVQYYCATAQAWERQALIRARSAAGDRALFTRFADGVRGSVYGRDGTVEEALRNVRLAKLKIDRHHAQDTRGFNVKLGRGGIREIEFIAQAVQLSYGGSDPWLRSPHTLIALGRLADRGFISARERTDLSEAYQFLRTLEHRLQMEHGLQTHVVPEDAARRTIVARRMNFAGAHALEEFDAALERHLARVRAIYDRVFGARSDSDAKSSGAVDGVGPPAIQAGTAAAIPLVAADRVPEADAPEALETIARALAGMLGGRVVRNGDNAGPLSTGRVAELVRGEAARALNPRRAMTLATRVAESLEHSTDEEALTAEQLTALVRLCGASERFAEMLCADPALVQALPLEDTAPSDDEYERLMSEAIEEGGPLAVSLSSLRRMHARLLLQIGALDAAGVISISEANRRQTMLAVASLNAGCRLAERELASRFGRLAHPARWSVLGLGRLGGRGMDYGSDLDVILIYDDGAPSPVPALAAQQAYARLGEHLVGALSSLTRDGYLYRVDLRLRPDGRNGPTCSGGSAFLDYLRARSRPWEWLAYVKLRAAAGDLDFGAAIEHEARQIVHDRAREIHVEDLRSETLRVRERLEREKGGRAPRQVDIKFGAGGMLDVYFASRYLQLRDRVPDDDADRSTAAVLTKLRDGGSLDSRDYAYLNEGYRHLRALDHYVRLVIGRSPQLPPAGHPALSGIASRMEFDSAGALGQATREAMSQIRRAYDHVLRTQA